MKQKYVILFYGLFNEFQSYDWIPYGLLYLAAKIKSINLNPILIHEYYNRDYEQTIKKYAKETIIFGVSAMSGYQILYLDLCNKIFQNMKDFDIQIMVSLIFGNPLETIEDLKLNRQCLSQWIEINPKVRFQICFFTPYPGTPMTDLAVKMGYVPPKTLEEFGTSIYFQDVARSKKQTIEWYSKDFTSEYLKRFDELFPDADKYRDAEWGWRKKKEVVGNGY